MAAGSSRKARSDVVDASVVVAAQLVGGAIVTDDIEVLRPLVHAGGVDIRLYRP
jgi:hypothetical protein